MKGQFFTFDEDSFTNLLNYLAVMYDLSKICIAHILTPRLTQIFGAGQRLGPIESLVTFVILFYRKIVPHNVLLSHNYQHKTIFFINQIMIQRLISIIFENYVKGKYVCKHEICCRT